MVPGVLEGLNRREGGWDTPLGSETRLPLESGNIGPIPEAGYLTGARGSSPPGPKGAFTRPFEVMVSGPDDVYVERKRPTATVGGREHGRSWKSAQSGCRAQNLGSGP